MTVSVQLTNVLNHFQPSGPSLSLVAHPLALSGRVYNPRQTEFGLRIVLRQPIHNKKRRRINSAPAAG